MGAESVHNRFIMLYETESTNLYAMNLLKNGLAENGDVVYTLYQTAGKGQRGNTWLSHKGDSILMSMIIKDLNYIQPGNFQLSAAVAIACASYLNQILIDCKLNHKASVQLKWPNDLIINDKKAGGILIESINQASGTKGYIIGIGINLNGSAPVHTQYGAISMGELTGNSFDPHQETIRLTERLDDVLQKLEATPLQDTLNAYNMQLWKKGEYYRLGINNSRACYFIREVDMAGNLICGEDSAYSFVSSEVAWLGPCTPANNQN